MNISCGLITISDRAAKGTYPDQSGPALKKAAVDYGWRVIAETVVPDERNPIQQALRAQIAQGCQLILTTGGTGIAPRDITPEVVREMAQCELPGFGEVMRLESLKITPHAILSRNLAAIVDQTLVVCFPGNPNAAVECLSFVAAAIPHAIALLREESAHSELKNS